MSKIKEMWKKFKEQQKEDGDFGDAVPVGPGAYTGQLVGGEIKEFGDDEVTKAVVKLRVLEAENFEDVGKTVTDFWNLEHEVGYKIACQTMRKMGAGDDATDDPEGFEDAFKELIAMRVCVRFQVKPSKKDDTFMQVSIKRVVEVDDDLKVDPDESAEPAAKKPAGKGKGKPADDDGDDDGGDATQTEHENAGGADEIVVGSKVKADGKKGEVVDVDGDEITVLIAGKKRIFNRADLELEGHAFDKKGKAGDGGEDGDGDGGAEDGQEIEPGDEVEWKTKGPKGKPVTCYGKVVSINKKKGSAKVEDGDGEERVVPLGDLTLQSA